MMYEDFQQMASELIEEFGLLRVLTKPAGPTHDPVSGALIDPAPVPTNHNVQAVKLSDIRNYEDKFTIQTGDAVYLVEATATEPVINDVLDGWTIVDVNKLEPADTVIRYLCQGRK